MGVEVQEFNYGVSWDHFLQKRRDDGRIGPREKSTWDAASMEPAADGVGISKAGVALRAVQNWALYPNTDQSLDAGVQGKGHGPW